MSFNYMQPFVTLAGGLQTQNAVAATEFNSMYESFNALTTVNKQHFVEWFSGDTLDSIWSFQDVIGSGGSGAMGDEVDGGYIITTSSGTLDASSIDFNNKRQYSHNNSVCIAVAKRGNTDVRYAVGFIRDASFFTTTTEKAGFFHGASGKIACWTNDGVTNGDTNTGTDVDTSWHSHKVECKSASVEFTLDGSLAVTRTTLLPDQNMQPTFQARAGTGGVDPAHIRYMECYNT